MSTKGTLKHYWDDAGKAGFHLYQECFDFENEFVYLELTGVPFEAAISIGSLWRRPKPGLDPSATGMGMQTWTN